MQRLGVGKDAGKQTPTPLPASRGEPLGLVMYARAVALGYTFFGFGTKLAKNVP